MRIGITNMFRGSAFAGVLPQVALYIGRALKDLGHDVNFILPEDSQEWFIDCSGANTIPSVRLTSGNNILTYHIIIEVVWFLPADFRRQLAHKYIMFYHYPPVFYDIENSTYPIASFPRTFELVDAIWTWSHFKKTDFEYLELLTRRPVFGCPFLWDPVLIDTYVAEGGVCGWDDGGDTKSWKAVICESNETNTSHCTLPLSIVSELVNSVEPELQWTVLNGETIKTREFFVNNILKNAHFKYEDISGNFIKRVRLPDLCREPSVIISHQRWRPIKHMLLDALYLGIPLIHNSEMLREAVGGEHFYELNRIGQAMDCWKNLKMPGARKPLADVRADLLRRWGPDNFKAVANDLLEKACSAVAVPIVGAICGKKPLRVAFFDMWADFKCGHNAFLANLISVHGADLVENNQRDPTIIVFGPFGTENLELRWNDIPKIFYTGENSPLQPAARTDVKLNIAFSRSEPSERHFRLPNWMIELDWFGLDKNLVVNPLPLSLDMLKPVLSIRSKFCIFVASNPNCPERNTLYNMITRYKEVDSAGMLFNNVERIPGGLGGSGGQSAKIEVYKQYKFALVCENSKTAGYTTEKLLHAKMAGCVPIYWGDPLVGLDFNPKSFINVADYKNMGDLLTMIKKVDNDADLWASYVNQPVISEERVAGLRVSWTQLAKRIKSIVIPESVAGGGEAIAVGTENKSNNASIPTYHSEFIGGVAGNKAIVTACNSDFVDSCCRLIKSAKVFDLPVYVWIWDDMPKHLIEKLADAGAAKITSFNSAWNPNWADFWNPKHFAWKPLLLTIANRSFTPATQILYLDSGIEIVNSLQPVWEKIFIDGFFVCDMEQHLQENWCKPDFCARLQMRQEDMKMPQYSANIIGFMAGGRYSAMLNDTMLLACDPNIIVGEKWHNYSAVSHGHRHDQSILTFLGGRCKIITSALEDYSGSVSSRYVKRSGKPFYVHRGQWKAFIPAAPGFDECHIINLKGRVDRLEKFYEGHPFFKVACQRWNATYGRDIVLTPEIVHLFRKNDFKWKKSVMGCALSHYGLWKKLRDDEESSAYLILEDDAKFSKEFQEQWLSMSKEIPADYDVILLGGVLPPNKEALPHVTEPVNGSFARVKQHNLFGGTVRRYFHFCAYSYILSRRGAAKLCALIDKEGIFTSADHMIVNHGDSLLNIYFTTPLVAGCFQDDDPKYQNADFNNFDRVDSFDSDLWNNMEAFSPEEVLVASGSASGVVSAKADLKIVVSEESPKATEFIHMVYFEDHQPKDSINSQWLAEIFPVPFKWISAQDAEGLNNRHINVFVFYEHTTPISVIEGWINRHMDLRLFLFHASDEACTADVSLYGHPGVRAVFRNYWRPSVVGEKVMHIPLGYLNDKGSSSSEGSSEVISKRKYVWSFAGAMDRPNRNEIIKHLCDTVPSQALHTTPTWGSPFNIGPARYVNMMRNAKFIPCLSGFYNVECYRFYEALEQGCLPIIPNNEEKTYNNILGGSGEEPLLLGVSDWMTAGQVMNTLSANPAVLDDAQAKIQTWWKKFKIDLSGRIALKIAGV